MLHQIVYGIHMLGMAAIIVISLYSVIKNNIDSEIQKKLARYLLSASHAQLLSGFALFILLFSEINHMKIGIKMLLAIEIAVIATINNKKIKKGIASNFPYNLTILVSAISAIAVAFLL